MSDKKIAAMLRRAMQLAKSDEFERANHRFASWDDAKLDEQYGESGKTGRQIWQDCKDERADWEKANAFLEEVLTARGL